MLCIAGLLCFDAYHAGFGHFVSRLSKSKLSIHTGLGSASWDFIKATQPRIVKILDNFGSNPAQVKALAPGCKVIGRIYQASQPMTGDATQAAQNWWNSVSSTILGSPDVE